MFCLTRAAFNLAHDNHCEDSYTTPIDMETNAGVYGHFVPRTKSYFAP